VKINRNSFVSSDYTAITFINTQNVTLENSIFNNNDFENVSIAFTWSSNIQFGNYLISDSQLNAVLFYCSEYSTIEFINTTFAQPYCSSMFTIGLVLNSMHFLSLLSSSSATSLSLLRLQC
jgi:hypothetical protein